MPWVTQLRSAVAESLVELAASAIDMESMEMRRLNMAADDDYPNKTVTGIPLENLSHQASTKKLMEMVDYQEIREEQAELRKVRGYIAALDLAL